ncbi:TetR/AcrR family transcriptional regulator [Actinoplanes sp. LDG1-06]|uniref:TetR/AcrR family transcriptional regulator n=1 Tax=Paractinoplanes ovalisporus TaxID=2810368 RepID=A0ABS2AKV6_9ACTN|nr:TetR/AcrR family transcriptional regulator [Actinoplanes ovalisporus]MBM2620473.1 TetR/AcrR family transcriptional regulator [Actinoplanes ovalisporus]
MPGRETRDTYHHGALREELINACLVLIESEGIGAVSLRRVAREAGVSAGAPYHHFEDRATLLNVITAQGFGILVGDMRAARDGAATAVEALGAIIESYVRFVRGHMGYAQLMYRPELIETTKGGPAAQALAQEAIQLTTDTVLAAQREGGAPAGDPMPLVTLVWSLCAGLAMLSADGPLEQMSAEQGSDLGELAAQVSALFQRMLACSAA